MTVSEKVLEDALLATKRATPRTSNNLKEVVVRDADGPLETSHSIGCAAIRTWCWLLVALTLATGAERFFSYGRELSRTPLADLERAEFVVDVNLAPKHELEALPDVGAALATRIIEYRQTHGLFMQLDDLLNVRGVGHRTLEQLRPRLILTTPQPDHTVKR